MSALPAITSGIATNLIKVYFRGTIQTINLSEKSTVFKVLYKVLYGNRFISNTNYHTNIIQYRFRKVLDQEAVGDYIIDGEFEIGSTYIVIETVKSGFAIVCNDKVELFRIGFPASEYYIKFKKALYDYNDGVHGKFIGEPLETRVYHARDIIQWSVGSFFTFNISTLSILCVSLLILLKSLN